MSCDWPLLSLVDSIPKTVWFAGGGGLAIKLLDLADLADTRKANWPNFKSPLYYVLFLIHPALAMFLVAAYVASNIEMTPILAVNVGITAPLILKAMRSKTPDGVNVPPGA
jgi:hypothetical protein